MKEKKSVVFGVEISLPDGCPAKARHFKPQFYGEGKHEIILKCVSYKPERKSCSECAIGQKPLVCTFKVGNLAVKNP